MTPDELLQGLLHGTPLVQRRAVAKSITLLESTRADQGHLADEFLARLLPHTGKSFRLGISGVPGVGKSTLIEALGLRLIGQGLRVAVLAIDPSSTVSGGSILGDKTRMEQLSTHLDAYIRPSPSRGKLGGVAEKTREAIVICDAVGYDIIIVETVGVGQSETTVANMTDMFCLMQLPNAGDDLQAMKKGVLEIADLVIINKADTDSAAASLAEFQITSAMRLIRPKSDPIEKRWAPRVLRTSALLGQGVDDFWSVVNEFKALQVGTGEFAWRRERQALAWMWERVDIGLRHSFRTQANVLALLPGLSERVRQGQVNPSAAARQLLNAWRSPK